MSRDPSGGRSSRWDTERSVRERERERPRDRVEELLRPQRVVGGELVTRPRERSVDATYERRIGPGGRIYEDERYKERDYYDEPPRQQLRPRRESVTIDTERDREIYSPSPPRRTPAIPRPGLIRRQSSLDTFDRRPLPRYEREEYRNPFPQRRFGERDDEGPYRPYPERVLERETIRSRRRSPSRERGARSFSASSSSSSELSVRRESPKRGLTKIPSRLVSIKAIIDLGYPYKRDGETIIVQKALRPEHIDEVMKLSEVYKRTEKIEMSGGRGSAAGEIIEERREVIRDIPPQYGRGEIIEKTTIDRRELMRPPLYTGRSHSAGPAPRIVDASPAEYTERSSRNESNALVVREKRYPSEVRIDNRYTPDVVIEQRRPSEIEERTTLKVETNRGIEIKKDDIIRRDEIIRRGGKGGELIVIEDDRRDRRRRYSSVENRRDKKAAQARAISTMMKTLT